MNRIRISDLIESKDFGKEVTVMGWVKTIRGSKNVSFIALNDGSCLKNMQVVADAETIPGEILDKIHSGAALKIVGELVESQGKGQVNEIQAGTIDVLGEADPDTYPIQPKRHSLEFLRENAHLRFRTNLFGAITRVRHSMIFAIHKFFNDRGFYNIHSPIITGSDAEGAGEMFQVTTLNMENPPKNEDGTID